MALFYGFQRPISSNEEKVSQNRRLLSPNRKQRKKKVSQKLVCLANSV